MSVVAFDTETKGLDWFDPNQQAFLVTWADADGTYWADLSDGESAQVGRFIEAIHAADVVVAHNAKFDIHMIRATLGFDIAALGKQLEDTDLMSRVLHPEGQRKGERGGHGLKNLAKVYLRVDAADPEDAIKEMAKSIGLRTLKQNGAYYDVYRSYPNEMVTYALADARYTYDLYEQFRRDAVGDRIYELELDVLPILVEAERVGIATDQAQVAAFKRQFTDEKNALHDRLSAELGDDALGGEGSEDALREGLLKHGIPLTERTPTGELSTSKFALQDFERDFPLIADLMEYRKLERFLTTYLGAVDGVDVVHPSFGQIGAWTGRMSCRSPNLQNWPQRAGKEVRSVLVPRSGHAFVVVDYATIEIRLLAYYLGDAGFRQLIADGHDTHSWMAAQIWGGDPYDYRKDGPLAEGEHSRKTARHTLFAVCYGAGANRISKQLGIPYDEAKVLVSKVKASLPNYWHLTKHRIEPKIKSVGYVNTIIGRRNPVKRDRAYVGLNALIQGSAADIMKLGLVNVAREVKPYGATPLLVVHDEVVVETPLGTEDEVLDVTKKAMIAAYDLNPSLGVEGSICYRNYSEA